MGIHMNNNDWMLAAARDGNTVVNELHKTNSKIISLAKTIARLQLAIVLNVTDLNQFTSKKYLIKYILRKSF